MADIARFEAQVEIKSPVREFYGFFKNNMHNLVQMFPEQLKSFQLLDADEIMAGSLIHWKYDLGCPMAAKVRVEDIDEEGMSITFNVVEGDVLGFYKSFKAKLQVMEVRDGVGFAEWSLEFEKTKDHEDAPYPEHYYVDFAVKMSQGLDAYLSPS